jgi:hypothetical protein
MEASADLACSEVRLFLIHDPVTHLNLRPFDLQVVVAFLALLRHTRSQRHRLEHPLLTFLEVADNDIYVLYQR